MDCVRCGYPLDPVIVDEGYDTHPSCGVLTIVRTRPPGIGAGLMGPECPQRALLAQTVPEPTTAMCVRCGRITARRDIDGMPWCGGSTVKMTNRVG
jgi:hypothetical protein